MTFYINGVKYEEVAIGANGQAIVPDVLIIGNNTVVAIYNGDVNYTSSRNSSIQDNVLGMLSYVSSADKTRLKIRNPANANGFVLFLVAVVAFDAEVPVPPIEKYGCLSCL